MFISQLRNIFHKHRVR